jgi:tRNA(His) 5'-end guanylyltransferase
MEKGAMFDSRCFNIPMEEVINCLIWRQQDATRNAIQMLGQCNFSHRELHGMSCNDIQDMLMLQRDINFNDMPTDYKRGTCCYKKEIPCPDRLIGYKTEWVIDKDPPIFSKDREFVEKWVYMKEC